jgi:hypothetical protein
MRRVSTRGACYVSCMAMRPLAVAITPVTVAARPAASQDADRVGWRGARRGRPLAGGARASHRSET